LVRVALLAHLRRLVLTVLTRFLLPLFATVAVVGVEPLLMARMAVRVVLVAGTGAMSAGLERLGRAMTVV